MQMFRTMYQQARKHPGVSLTLIWPLLLTFSIIIPPSVKLRNAEMTYMAIVCFSENRWGLWKSVAFNVYYEHVSKWASHFEYRVRVKDLSNASAEGLYITPHKQNRHCLLKQELYYWWPRFMSFVWQVTKTKWMAVTQTPPSHVKLPVCLTVTDIKSDFVVKRTITSESFTGLCIFSLFFISEACTWHDVKGFVFNEQTKKIQ